MNIEGLLLSSQSGSGSFLFFGVVIMIIITVIRVKNGAAIFETPTTNFIDETDFFYVKELLVFTAHIINIDGNVSKKETEYVNKFMFREYGKRKQKKFVSIIANYLRDGYNLEKAVKGVNAKCDMSSKLQLLHFLIKVCVVDGFLTDSESKALSEITRKLNLTYHQLNSILAMYSYNSEKKEREKKQYNQQKKSTSKSKVKLSLTILELDNTATDDDIKKAYRKLVIIHHPDKVLHLDNVQKKASKEKFLKISEAYEHLKDKRGFK